MACSYAPTAERRREHAFRGLLAEYAAAIRLGDGRLEEHIGGELVKAYLDQRCADPLEGGTARCRAVPLAEIASEE